MISARRCACARSGRSIAHRKPRMFMPAGRTVWAAAAAELKFAAGELALELAPCFSDGYRLGARQMSVTIALEGDGSAMSGDRWAEAVFLATNYPSGSTDPVVAGIQHALSTQVHSTLQSLPVGDTVTVHGRMWACDPTGWHEVGTRPVDDLHR